MTYSQPEEGTIPFTVPSTGAAAHTYYKVFGSLQSGRPPVIVLHGGPAAGHEYCLPFQQLWSLYGIPTIFYDQIGCAKSAHFPEKVYDEVFWHPDLFVAELENLIAQFSLDRSDGPGYDVLGHSWGAMLGSYFASRQPKGLRRLIMASATSNAETFCNGLWKKLGQLSKVAQRAVEEAIAKDDCTAPEYLAAMHEFSSTFRCRGRPYPPPLLAINNAHQKEDPTVGLTFLGKSLFIFNGLMRRWSSVPRVHKIAVSTLLINGEIDTSFDEEQMPFFERIPKVRWVTISGASHMYWLDSDELEGKTLKLVGEFLQQLDEGKGEGERWKV